jgi:hypothetical protein
MNEKDAAIEFLTADGNLRVPCSRYGFDSASCAPVAYAAAVIVACEQGEALTEADLDYMMGLVVNDHDDPGYLIQNYGAEYGFDATDYLDPDDD